MRIYSNGCWFLPLIKKNIPLVIYYHPVFLILQVIFNHLISFLAFEGHDFTYLSLQFTHIFTTTPPNILYLPIYPSNYTFLLTFLIFCKKKNEVIINNPSNNFCDVSDEFRPMKLVTTGTLNFHHQFLSLVGPTNFKFVGLFRSLFSHFWRVFF